MALHAEVQSLIPPRQPSPAGVGDLAQQLRSANDMDTLQDVLGKFAEAAEASLNQIHLAVRKTSNVTNQILVTDSTGKVIGAIGTFVYR